MLIANHKKNFEKKKYWASNNHKLLRSIYHDELPFRKKQNHSKQWQRLINHPTKITTSAPNNRINFYRSQLNSADDLLILGHKSR